MAVLMPINRPALSSRGPGTPRLQIEMAGTREPAQHPSAHLLLDCGEILWPQRGRLGELDLPVRRRPGSACSHAG